MNTPPSAACTTIWRFLVYTSGYDMKKFPHPETARAWRIGSFVWGIALLLRLYRLGAQGLFLDEAWSWDVTRLPAREILLLPRFDPHPVGYYLLLKAALHLLPATPAGLRLPSAAGSLLALALLMALAFRLGDSRAAAAAGLLAAVSSFDVYYAQEARMYTLLAAGVLFSLLALLRALDGRPHGFLLWGGGAALLPWIHTYGVLYLGAEAGVVLSWSVRRTLQERRLSRPVTYALLSLAVTGLSALPAALMALRYVSGGAGGAWVPLWSDLWMLGGLISAGLPAARLHFLDAAHLVPPLLPQAGPGAWAAAGMLAFSLPLLSGGWAALQKAGAAVRRDAAVAGWVACFPVVCAFGYAWWMQARLWAYKPLLASALLLYALVGWGLSRWPAGARFAWLSLCLLLGAASLWPYYRSWRKTLLPAALEQVAPASENWALLLNPPYLAPVAYFYLGVDTPLWGFSPDGVLSAYPSPFSAGGAQPPRPLSCRDAAVQQAREIWLYGMAPGALSPFPCLEGRTVRVYTDGLWRKLPRPSGP